MTPDWILRLIEIAKRELPKDFVGQIEIHVFKGTISHVNVKQSFKDEGSRERRADH